MQAKILLLCVLGATFLSAVLADDVDCSKPPQRIDPKSCCPLPEFVSDEIMEKCKEFQMTPEPATAEESSNESYDSTENPRPDSSRPRPPHHHHHHKHHHHPCHAECVLNETGIFENQQLNEENLKAYLGTVLGAIPDMIPVAEQAFKTCVAKGEEFRAKMKELKKDSTRPSPPPEVVDHMMHQHCHPGSTWLMFCTYKEIFKNCASSVWSNTEQCNQHREYMNSCKPRFGPHSHSQENSVEE